MNADIQKRLRGIVPSVGIPLKRYRIRSNIARFAAVNTFVVGKITTKKIASK